MRWLIFKRNACLKYSDQMIYVMMMNDQMMNDVKIKIFYFQNNKSVYVEKKS